MKKRLLTGVFALVAYSQVAIAQPLISADGVQVNADELALAIENILPERTQQGMHEKEENIRLFLLDYFTFKMMGEAAQQQGLGEKPEVQVQQAYNGSKVLTQALIQEYIASAQEPNYEALAYEAYLSNQQSFKQPEQVHAAHILIAVNAEQNDADALKKANDIYQQVKKDKAQFAALAKKYSDDPSAQTNAGDLGFFTREAMVKPFSDAAFSQKKGTVSEPIKSDFGYHIIHTLEYKKAALKPFAEVKDELIEKEKNNFVRAKRLEIVGQYRSNDSIQIDEKAYIDFVNAWQKND